MSNFTFHYSLNNYFVIFIYIHEIVFLSFFFSNCVIYCKFMCVYVPNSHEAILLIVILFVLDLILWGSGKP